MYYNVQDVMGLTGLAQNKCYEMIRELNKSYKKDYPKAVLAQGHIPKWYFNECMGIKEEVTENEKEKTTTKKEY